MKVILRADVESEPNAGKTSAIVKPGKTAVLVVTLTKGKHPFSVLKGYSAAAMKGMLNVA